MLFDKLNLISPIRRALMTEGYTIPTEIQGTGNSTHS